MPDKNMFWRNDKNMEIEEHYEQMELYSSNLLERLSEFNNDISDNEPSISLCISFRILENQTEEYSLQKLRTFFNTYNKVKILRIFPDVQFIDPIKDNYLFIESVVSDPNFNKLHIPKKNTFN